jgi:hypothetical protein
MKSDAHICVFQIGKAKIHKVAGAANKNIGHNIDFDWGPPSQVQLNSNRFSN